MCTNRGSTISAAPPSPLSPVSQSRQQPAPPPLSAASPVSASRRESLVGHHPPHGARTGGRRYPPPLHPLCCPWPDRVNSWLRFLCWPLPLIPIDRRRCLVGHHPPQVAWSGLVDICRPSIPFTTRCPIASTAVVSPLCWSLPLFPAGRRWCLVDRRTLHGREVAEIRRPSILFVAFGPIASTAAVNLSVGRFLCFLPVVGGVLLASTHRMLHGWGLTEIRRPSIPFSAGGQLASTAGQASSVGRFLVSRQSLEASCWPPPAARCTAGGSRIFVASPTPSPLVARLPQQPASGLRDHVHRRWVERHQSH